ncbi:MAG: hypothetical protein R3F60_24300 [bacterium]
MAIAAGVAAGFLAGQVTARWERSAVVRAAPTPLEHLPALGIVLPRKAP